MYALAIRCVLLLLLSAIGLAGAQPAELPSFTLVPGQVAQAAVVLETGGPVMLRLTLTQEKKKEFAEFTRSNLEKQVQIVVLGKALTRPVIRDVIISGDLAFLFASPEEALGYAKRFAAGKLEKMPSWWAD